MNFKQKLGYMCIGCLFTIAGYILASLGGITTHAQQKEQVLDKIVCRELQVVNKEGKPVAIIKGDVGGGGGVFVITNKEGSPAAMILANENGTGEFRVVDKKLGIAVAKMGQDGFGTGFVTLKNKVGKQIVTLLGNNVGEGGMILGDQSGKPRVKMIASESSGINLYDKHGTEIIIIAELVGRGGMAINNAEGNTVVEISSSKMGDGGMFIKNNEGKDKVRLITSENSGYVGISSIENKEVVIIGASESGDGVIQTYKGGWRIH